MKKGVIGIDLGTESVKAVALEQIDGESMPRILGIGAALNRGGMRKGIVIEPQETANAVKEAIDSLEKSTGIKSGEACFALGGIGLGFQKAKGLIAISRADGEVTREDQKRAVQASESNLNRIQNRGILHQIPISYQIDGEMPVQDPVGLIGTRLESEVMFITAFSQNIKNAIKALEEADVNAEEMVAAPLAAAASSLDKREREIGVALLDLGAYTTSLIVFQEGLPYSLEVLPVGSGHITNDIAMMFKISLDEAEKLKINFGVVGKETSSQKKDDIVYGNYSKKKLTGIIEARLGDIFELVEKHLKKVDMADLLASGIVMVGGGANLSGLESFAREQLNLPARIAEPSNLGGFKDKIRNPAWSTAVGTALIALEKQRSASPLFRGKSGLLVKWLRAFLP